MRAREQFGLAVLTILLSGVLAAVISALMTAWFERKKALLDRRLTAAADFAAAATRASNSLDVLVDKASLPGFPDGDELGRLFELADAAEAQIGAAGEHAGLVRVLYGPSDAASGHANEWIARSHRELRTARGVLWVIQPFVVEGLHRPDADELKRLQQEMRDEQRRAREARHEFERAASAEWSKVDRPSST